MGVYEVNVSMGYTGYIFGQGNRIRVTVSSAADPYFWPTSNTGANDPEETTRWKRPVTPIVARNTVHISKEYPSRVFLPLVSKASIPENHHFTSAGPFAQDQPEIVV